MGQHSAAAGLSGRLAGGFLAERPSTVRVAVADRVADLVGQGAFTVDVDADEGLGRHIEERARNVLRRMARFVRRPVLHERVVLCGHRDQRLTGPPGAWPALPDEDDRRLRIRGQIEKLESESVDVDLVVRRSHRQAADVVAAIASEQDGDVIVCSTRGLGALSGTLLGSFTRRPHVAPCPVLAVPETEKGERRPAPAEGREKVEV